MTRLVFGRVLDFRSWYEENLQPGDEFFVRLLESAETGEQGLAFSLPKTEETEEVTRELDNSRVVPVRPDWVDNRGLLGYLNPITGTLLRDPVSLTAARGGGGGSEGQQGRPATACLLRRARRDEPRPGGALLFGFPIGFGVGEADSASR